MTFLIPKAPTHNRVKQGVFRDLAYHKAIKSQELPCALTGIYGTEQDQVVFAHMGITGKGCKAPDNEAIPMLNSLHLRSHSQAGCMSFTGFVCELFQNDNRLCVDVMQAFARDYHWQWSLKNDRE